MLSNKPSITLTAAILPMLDCRGAVNLRCTIISISLLLVEKIRDVEDNVPPSKNVPKQPPL